jgi:hypothetical protein
VDWRGIESKIKCLQSDYTAPRPLIVQYLAGHNTLDESLLAEMETCTRECLYRQTSMSHIQYSRVATVGSTGGMASMFDETEESRSQFASLKRQTSVTNFVRSRSIEDVSDDSAKWVGLKLV